jgi:Bax protein
LDLAQGPTSCSERDQEYVDTRYLIVWDSNPRTADDVTFRDEPLQFLVGADSAAAPAEVRKEIERMRASGQLNEIIERMRLD